MNERQLRQYIHAAIIGEFLQDPMWISKASEEDKQRLWNTSTRIIASLKEQFGFELDGTAMQVTHLPQRVLPEEHIVTFSEIEYPNLAYQEVAVDKFGNRGPGETKFAAEVETWLNDKAPGWSVEWDRGDWGEGWYIAHLRLPSSAHVQDFLAKWGKDPAC